MLRPQPLLLFLCELYRRLMIRLECVPDPLRETSILRGPFDACPINFEQMVNPVRVRPTVSTFFAVEKTRVDDPHAPAACQFDEVFRPRYLCVDDRYHVRGLRRQNERPLIKSCVVAAPAGPHMKNEIIFLIAVQVSTVHAPHMTKVPVTDLLRPEEKLTARVQNRCEDAVVFFRRRQPKRGPR